MHGTEAWKSCDSPAGFKYYLHASFSFVNVCNKVIHQSPEAITVPQCHGTSVRKPLDVAPLGVPLWISLNPCELCPISAEQTTGDERGQRAPLDVLQLPIGNVSPSHRWGITNSLLSVLTSDGGCSKLTSTPCPQRIMRDKRNNCLPLNGKFISSGAQRAFDKSILHISSHRSGNVV